MTHILRSYLPNLRMDHREIRTGKFDWCDDPHICPDCVADILFMIQIEKIEITEGFMAALPPKLKQKVVAEICLRSLK
jgi:hypothetical protein